MVRMFTSLLVGVLMVAACGGDAAAPDISDVRIGQPTGPNAALYFTVNSDEADRLLGATTSVAGSVQLHETIMGDDGSMGMEPIDSLEVPADTEVVLEPGGTHLMLIDVDRLEVGDKVEVLLTWENAGDLTVDAEVVEPQDTLEHDGHGG